MAIHHASSLVFACLFAIGCGSSDDGGTGDGTDTGTELDTAIGGDGDHVDGTTNDTGHGDGSATDSGHPDGTGGDSVVGDSTSTDAKSDAVDARDAVIDSGKGDAADGGDACTPVPDDPKRGTGCGAPADCPAGYDCFDNGSGDTTCEIRCTTATACVCPAGTTCIPITGGGGGRYCG